MTEGKTRKRIASALVADDDGATRLGLLQFLREKLDIRNTFEVHRFTDALETLKTQNIELALFDLGIPGLKSPRELAQIRETWPDVKVVVLSASDLRSNILASLDAGVHGYVIKQATMENLAKSLGRVMDGEIYVPPSLADITKGLNSHDDRQPFVVAGAPSEPKLTQRQKQVLRGIIKGQSNKQLAKDLKLSIGTVKMHVSGVLTALGAQSRSHAAAIGRKFID